MRKYDDKFNEFINNIKLKCSIVSYETWAMGWTAILNIHVIKYRVTSDRGYINVDKIENGVEKSLYVPENMRVEISTKQVAELISNDINGLTSR